MQSRSTFVHSALAIALAAGLGACGGGGGGAEPGTLKLALTDAPACGFDHVYVTVQKVRVHALDTAQNADAGWSEVTLNPPRRIDLLALTNGALEELGSTTLPPGRYTQMRLVLAAGSEGQPLPHAVVPAGGDAQLPLAAGQGGTLQVPVDFQVATGQTTDLVVDVDACRSIAPAASSGTYQLKPAVSVLPRTPFGIQGTVAGSLVPAQARISAQQDGVTVRATSADARGNFRIPFLRPGAYTLVIAAEGHATAVVTDVPVDGGMTTVNAADSAISPPTSAMAEIKGSLAMADAETAGAALAPDAEVRASQALSDGKSIDVVSRPADAVNGSYVLKVPTTAPVKAAYRSAGGLSFAADAADAGRYSLDVLARGN